MHYYYYYYYDYDYLIAGQAGLGHTQGGLASLSQSSSASSEEVTQAQTAPLIVAVDSKGHAAVFIATWGVPTDV